MSLVPRARSVILFNLLVLVFASIISIVKEAPTMLDPDLLNITRFTIAAIPFVLFLLKSIRDMQVVIRGVELGIWVTLAYLTQSIGLVTADAGRASFISALTVIIVPFLEQKYLHIHDLEHVYQFSGLVGDLLTLLSAFCFGIHMLRTEHISRKMKKENFLALVGCQVVVVAVVLAVSSIVKCFLQNVVPWKLKSRTPTELFSMMSSFPWLAILYTGIIATTFCLWAIVAMRDVSATETAIIYGLEPVWVLLLHGQFMVSDGTLLDLLELSSP
ncbi:putative transporter [Hordeum vulgare]|nr:putative transporter [Hordeum vulgare]